MKDVKIEIDTTENN